MRRSERLTEIIEIIRDGRLHLARDIAAALEVSERTVYRDIATLIASGVPVEGERGVGYLLREPVFLPPLALSLNELEALSLGMSLVQEIADAELREGAKTLHAKIVSHALNRRKMPEAWGFGLYEFKRVREGLKYMPVLRRAIRERCKLRIGYRSLVGERSAREPSDHCRPTTGGGCGPSQHGVKGEVTSGCFASIELIGATKPASIFRMSRARPSEII